jgi:hypothetical protein
VALARTAVAVGIKDAVVRATVEGGEGSRVAVAPLGKRLREVAGHLHVLTTSHTCVITAHRTMAETLASVSDLSLGSVAMCRYFRHRSVL